MLRPGASHYTPISWPDAFQLVADELNTLASPNEAIFYMSGKVPDEPAYLYQLFVRQFGTNNLPDCLNMCHESSGSALSPTLGPGSGSVTLNDIHKAEVILIMGQNPGVNHPRMLTALQMAKCDGAKIIAVNPLHKAGLSHFKNPQDFMNPLKAVGTLLGDGTPIADLHLQVKINGDMAVLRGIIKHLLRAEELNPGEVIDQAFIEEYTANYDTFLATIRNTSWESIEQLSGQSDCSQAENHYLLGHGLTQQKSGVMTIQKIVNLHLLKGAMGKPGSSTCPVRGHSNVQERGIRGRQLVTITSHFEGQ
ncbi:molybdopterin-dependent oxidoreductase [Spirosoma agri]|uniref:Molybdopterin-dependent oxidoreductase n=1 Tax=Spirosoma agri TaxID=1987381 RepID=A0A6M0IRX6_9BACT|nr:molybdopterin-dependent oxidoreductase [Spirosoma agri]NEU70131.1 molybdopterin-dependent oxidoreductase [Spirosoma agri]